MSKQEKKKLTVLTTPAGVVKFAHLNRPDTKFDPDGEYNCKLLIDAEDAEELCEKIETEAQAVYDNFITTLKPAQAKKIDLHLPFEEELDETTGEPTGRIVFNAKQKAKITVKKTGETFEIAPKIFDATPTLLTKPPLIYSGSTIKLQVALVPMESAGLKKGGITLRLNAAQIIELVSSAGGNAKASDYGFGSEDGFAAVDNEDTSGFENEESGEEDPTDF